jgi:pyruvate/2-oxoglutarate dehydrogenase complex dihydrolipoamide dehydrogenase (E3) component
MSNDNHFDAIVIGSGQAGTPLSRTLAEAGLRTALIERSHVGGTCVNEGCTPTKTMVASGRVAYLARRAADYGVHTGTITVDMKRVRQRKRDIVNSFRSGSQNRLEKTDKLDLIFGTASFAGPKSISIQLAAGGQRTITADKIFINAGTRAAVPSIDGLRDVSFFDNISIMELDAVPDHLIVIGGGYIGLEFGQLFRRLGSRVTLVHSNALLLNREDPDVAEEVAKILREDGIELVMEAKTQKVSMSQGSVQLDVTAAGASRRLTGSHLLIATGRVSNADTLNLTAAGVVTDSRGFIKTNNLLETNVAGIFALGDIKGGPAFTHISYDDYRIAYANAVKNEGRTTDGRMIPYTVFIDPQLGRVGLSETDAKAQGKKFTVAKMPMNYVARALEMDESRGFMKALVDPDSKQILGAAVLGIEGGELMALFELAMMGKLPYTALRDGIFSHPTLAESLNNLFASI